MRARILSLLLLITAVLFVEAAWACPSCKEAISGQDPASLQLARGYARSIYLLMSTPYLLFAGLAFTIAHQARKKKGCG